MEIQELIRSMITSIIDHEDQIDINEEVGPDSLRYWVSVSKEDVGKVIGKNGRVANALRTIAKAAGAKNKVRVSIVIKGSPMNLTSSP